MSFVKFEGDGKINISGEIVDLLALWNKNKLVEIMPAAEYFSMVENNKKLYAGSGMIEHPGSKFGPIATEDFKDFNTISVRGYPNYKPFVNSLMVNPLHCNTDSGKNRYNKHEYNISGHIVELRSFGRGTGALGDHSGLGSESSAIPFPEAPTLNGVETDLTSASKDYSRGDFMLITDKTTNLLVNNTLQSSDHFTLTDNNNGTYTIYSKPSGEGSGEKYIYFTNSDNALPVNGTYRFELPIINKPSNIDKIQIMCYGGFPATDVKIVDDSITVDFTTDRLYDGHNIVKLTNMPDDTTLTVGTPKITLLKDTIVVVNTDIAAGDNIAEHKHNLYAQNDVSRRDWVFLESWIEKIDTHPGSPVYMRGCVQDNGMVVTPLMPEPVDMDFPDSQKYSAFGDWDTDPHVYKGYYWDDLTTEQKRIFSGDPDNKIFTDGKNIYQHRHRIRVIKGIGNAEMSSPSDTEWGRVLNATRDNTHLSVRGPGLSSEDLVSLSDSVNVYMGGYQTHPEHPEQKELGVWKARPVDGSTYGEFNATRMIPLFSVQRRNNGAYHPFHNPSGCGVIFSDTDGGWDDWNSDAGRTHLTSTIACFDFAILPNQLGRVVDLPYLGAHGLSTAEISGRPDGRKYDGIVVEDIFDMRKIANKYDTPTILKNVFHDFKYQKYRRNGTGSTVVKGIINTIVEGHGMDNDRKCGYINMGKLTHNHMPPMIESRTVQHHQKISIVVWNKTKDTTAMGNWYDNSSIYIYNKDGKPSTLSELRELFEVGNEIAVIVMGESDVKSLYNITQSEIIGHPRNYPQWLKDKINNNEYIGANLRMTDYRGREIGNVFRRHTPLVGSYVVILGNNSVVDNANFTATVLYPDGTAIPLNTNNGEAVGSAWIPNDGNRIFVRPKNEWDDDFVVHVTYLSNSGLGLSNDYAYDEIVEVNDNVLSLTGNDDTVASFSNSLLNKPLQLHPYNIVVGKYMEHKITDKEYWRHEKINIKGRGVETGIKLLPFLCKHNNVLKLGINYEELVVDSNKTINLITEPKVWVRKGDVYKIGPGIKSALAGLTVEAKVGWSLQLDDENFGRWIVRNNGDITWSNNIGTLYFRVYEPDIVHASDKSVIAPPNTLIPTNSGYHAIRGTKMLETQYHPPL